MDSQLKLITVGDTYGKVPMVVSASLLGLLAMCVNEKDDPRFATICSFSTEGEDFRIEAKGVRNSVGFDWHPETQDFYFTDNGRDYLGDDLPPCELNVLKSGEEGSHYGFPYFWGDNQPDPEFGR